MSRFSFDGVDVPCLFGLDALEESPDGVPPCDGKAALIVAAGRCLDWASWDNFEVGRERCSDGADEAEGSAE